MQVSQRTSAPALHLRRVSLWQFVPLAAVVVFLLVLSFRLSPAFGVFATYMAFVLMALPGVFLGLALFGWDIRRQPESLIFGIPLGLMLSGYVAIMLGFLHGWSAPSVSIALLILAILAGAVAVSRRRANPLVVLRPWSALDYCVLGGMGLIVLGFVAIPFSRIGQLTPDGHAYTWLFGYDFILRAAYAASITLGLPIDHIHMAGVPLHMYLVGYVLPALSYGLCGEAVHLDAILVVTELLLDLMFLSCLFAFLRLFAKSARALLATAVLALIGYSYYGLLVLARHATPWLPASFATSLERQFAFGSVSHLFQRLFMVEPQAILALAVFLFVMTIVLSSRERLSVPVAVFLGLAIGIEFGIDSWLGLTIAAWFGAVQLMRLWSPNGHRRVWLPSVLVAVLAVTLWCTFFMVRMVGVSSGGLVSVRPYMWGLKFGILQYALEYGPMLPLGLLGLWSLRRSSRFQAFALGLIAVFAVLQDLFVTVAELPHFRIGNRLLPLVFLAGAAWLFEKARWTRITQTLALAAIVFATPTFITDILGASNIADRHQTFYVRTADLDACEWIRTHLPHSTIIQGKPDYMGNFQLSPSLRGENEISLIPAFAFRRSALGAEYTARSMCAGCREISRQRESEIDAMFQARDGDTITSAAAKYGINYLYVGPYEQYQYPALLSILNISPRFQEVYDRDTVHVFRILDEKPPDAR